MLYTELCLKSVLGHYSRFRDWSIEHGKNNTKSSIQNLANNNMKFKYIIVWNISRPLPQITTKSDHKHTDINILHQCISNHHPTAIMRKMQSYLPNKHDFKLLQALRSHTLQYNLPLEIHNKQKEFSSPAKTLSHLLDTYQDTFFPYLRYSNAGP